MNRYQSEIEAINILNAKKRRVDQFGVHQIHNWSMHAQKLNIVSLNSCWELIQLNSMFQHITSALRDVIKTFHSSLWCQIQFLLFEQY